MVRHLGWWGLCVELATFLGWGLSVGVMHCLLVARLVAVSHCHWHATRMVCVEVTLGTLSFSTTTKVSIGNRCRGEDESCEDSRFHEGAGDHLV